MTYLQLIVLFLFLSLQSSCGQTDPRDAYAINSLYLALGSPPIPGWSSTDDDPCGHAWQGVECVFSNITAIKLPGENLGGQLGGYLEFFNSIITIDLSNNHIGGSIPPNLPTTMRIFSLSANQFTGIIPDNLSSLSQLTDLSLNNNHFTGNIPDAFQSLKGLTNLDLSGNSLGGPLPPSMSGLSSLTTLNLQNNQLSGMLDIIQDLPLINLNIENNLFSGPIPNKLLTVPNFRRDGNPFNTTILPSPPMLSPPGLPPGPSAGSAEAPMNSLGPSSSQPNSSSTSAFFTTKKVIWIGVGGAVILAIITLVACFFMSSRQKKKHVAGENSEKHDMGLYSSSHEKKKTNETFLQPNQSLEEGMANKVIKAEVGHDHKVLDIRSKPKVVQEMNGKRADTTQRHDEGYQLDMKQIDVKNQQSLQPASLLPAVGEQLKNPRLPLETGVKQHSTIDLNLESSIRVFTVGSLQQYTNSFSQGNLVGRGIVGSVYRAKLPDGKLLAIKKVDTATSGMQSGDEFLVLVSSISKLQHPNVVKLVGYCAEHGQQLLAFDYCRNGSLYDALHLDDEMRDKLSWSRRIQIALDTARALEYLHEFCHPPVVHKNFKSANLLLDDKLTVRLSDCGLTSLTSTGTLSRLTRHLSAAGYGAPELEFGSYTHLSDIYSFGVVMLELLTGRKSFDRSLPRGEQFLVGWAMPRLHDIDLLSRMVDPSLKGSYSSKSLSRFADIISLCIQPEPEFRPPMSEIVQSLLYMIQRELSA